MYFIDFNSLLFLQIFGILYRFTVISRLLRSELNFSFSLNLPNFFPVGRKSPSSSRTCPSTPTPALLRGIPVKKLRSGEALERRKSLRSLEGEASSPANITSD